MSAMRPFGSGAPRAFGAAPQPSAACLASVPRLGCDLCRARTDAVHDLRSGRYQLKAFLLRNGHRYTETTAWSAAHMRYLRELTLPHAAMKVVLEEYLQAIDAAGERIERLEVHMKALLEDWHMRPVVLALMGLRGYQTVAAMITVSEIGDIHRFAHPRQLMAYLGLVPSEPSRGPEARWTKRSVARRVPEQAERRHQSSSGDSRTQGSITKCGNGHLRWIFNECAQHYRLPPKVSSQLATRQEAIPKAHRRQVTEISWRCQNRLHEKGRKLAARGKTRQKVQTALARELSAFVWEVMRITTPKADGSYAQSTARAPVAKKSNPPATRSKSRDYVLHKHEATSGKASQPDQPARSGARGSDAPLRARKNPA